MGAEADLLEFLGKVLRQKIQDLLAFGRSTGVFNAGVNILRILPEDDHVHLFGMFHRRRHAVEPLHRAQADIKVQHLAQGDIEGADAAANGRGERPFDADEVFFEGLDGVIRQPVVESLETLLAGENFEPGDLAPAAVSFLHGGVEHAHAGRPDVRARPVAANERDDGVVRHIELAGLD